MDDVEDLQKMQAWENCQQLVEDKGERRDLAGDVIAGSTGPDRVNQVLLTVNN